jgi:epidermal growth factor receptor substrate 15
MGDHEDRSHTASPLQDQSAELGNVRNHLQSTTRSLEVTKAERARTESAVASQAVELSALQTQLSSAKAAYDTETTLLSQLKERFTTQSAEIQKTREELIRSESDLSAIRVEKAEIEQAFLRDKEEARDLHKRMVEAGQLADQLKAEVEKARKEAKQQKGRLAIARKQLSTKEAEKAKFAKELEDANAEVQSVIQEAEEAEAQLTKLMEQPQPVRALSQESVTIAAAQPLPPSPEQIGTSKSNNPFERLAMTSSPSPRSQSPFLPFGDAAMTSPPAAPVEGQNGQAKPETQSSFDDFFGVEAPAPIQEVSEEVLKPAPQSNGNSTPKDTNTGELYIDHRHSCSFLISVCPCTSLTYDRSKYRTFCYSSNDGQQ